MEFIEVSAKTVDDAITKACIELQAASDKLEIQVISEGSSCTGKGSAEKRSCKERNGKKICSASGRNCKTLRAKRRA